jgi:hypothetical protein
VEQAVWFLYTAALLANILLEVNPICHPTSIPKANLRDASDRLADNVRAEVAVGAALVSLLAQPLRQVRDNGDRQAVKLQRQFNRGLRDSG